MHRSRSPALWLMLALSLAASLGRAHAHDELVRAGVEFQVNLYTSGQQSFASAAMDADGDFVVTWHSYQDFGATGVFARRYSKTGDAVGTEFQVNTYTPTLQSYPSVAVEAGGDFVVVWQSFLQDDDSSDGVFARRFSATGAPLGLELQVNLVTAGNQRFPKVAVDADGDFVVAWEFQGIFARRFSSSGAAVGGEIQINQNTSMSGTKPAVAMDADGDFVVTWQNAGDNAGEAIFARRFSSAGAPLTGDFLVNTYTYSTEAESEVAVESNGDFIVIWQSNHDGDDIGIFARRFTSNGAATSSDFQVNTRTVGRQWFASVASDADGDFVVSWESQAGEDGDSAGVFAQRFASAGSRVGGELQVNAHTIGLQRRPAIASDADGDFVVAWQDYQQDGSLFGVFAQRFDDPIVTDVDGNGAAEPLTDGLLMLRYLFGFRGLTLINGAVDLIGCTRCNVPSIEAYLAEINN